MIMIMITVMIIIYLYSASILKVQKRLTGVTKKVIKMLFKKESLKFVYKKNGHRGAVHNVGRKSVPECGDCSRKRSCTACLQIKMRNHKIFR